MVLLKASGAWGVVALGAGMLVAAPAAAGTGAGAGAGAAFGLSSPTGVVTVAADECVGVAPTYADVMVRPAWTETIEHEATWLTRTRYTRWVVDQEYRPAVPEVSHLERAWSVEPLDGWTATGESRPVLLHPGTPGVPEIAEVTEQREVDPGQPYVAPTFEQVHHAAEYATVHHDAVFETVHHEAVYETVHHDAVLLYGFRQQTTGKLRWEPDPNWNAQGNPSSIGWEATGASQVLTPAWTEEKLISEAWVEHVLVSPARDEQVLVKEAWVEEVVVDPGQEYIPPTYETVVVVPYQPAVPAVPEQWGTELEYSLRVVTQEAVPEVLESGHEEERWSAAPPGDGWAPTGETRQVEDQAAWTEEIHHPAVYENQMVDPGVVCPEPGSDDGNGGEVGGDTGGDDGGGQGPDADSGVPGAVPGGPGATPGGRPATVVTVPVGSLTTKTPVVTPTVASPTRAVAAATLPSTGVGEGLLVVGGAAVVAGTALLAFRAWAARIAEGNGRHRGGLARGALAAGASAVARWRPFRRRAHRRTV